MSLSHLKGMRTRYSNLLTRELDKAKPLLTPGSKQDDLALQGKITNSLRKLNDYLSKLEDICERLAIEVEAAKLKKKKGKYNFKRRKIPQSSWK